MNKAVKWAAGAMLLGLAAVGGRGCDPVIPETSPDVLAPPCQEDEACWDCRTMGNRICGVTP